MGGLFGGPSIQPQNTVAPIAAGMRVQTSAYGLTIPVVFGRTRVAANLLWYGDFTPIPHTTTSSAGGGGGKGGGGGSTGNSQTTWTYTASFILGLSEGPITSVNGYWKDKEFISSVAPFTAFLGTYSQAAWSYLVSAHPSEAILYRGVAYAAAAAYDLDVNDFLPNHTFDITGLYPLNVGAGVYDANPGVVLTQLLTNSHWGAGFPAAMINSLTVYSNYCQAAGILISPAYTSQDAASSVITKLVQITNSGVYFSEGLLKVVPFGDSDLSGLGVTYTAPVGALYDLTDDDYISDIGVPPVTVTRNPNVDAFNQVQLEVFNNANEYNVETVAAQDQTAIDTYGLRPMSVITAREFCSVAAARVSAQQILQRGLYIRNQYKFVVGWRFCGLEPTDIITITDSTLQLSQYPVRVVSTEEDDNGNISMVCEDYPAGVSQGSAYPAQEGAGYTANYNASPGFVVAPAFIEAPIEQTTTGLMVGVAVIGASSIWGGCEIWVSSDGSNYRRMGIQNGGGSRYGVTTSSVTSAVGQTMGVQLAGNGGQMISGSTSDVANDATLCQVGDELVDYSTATLTATNAYTLTLAKRAAFSTIAASHSTTSKFVRVDETIQWSESLDLSLIGSTMYFKFLSFNIYGGGGQSLADVPAYTYTLTGVMAQLPPSNVTLFAAATTSIGVLLTWVDIPDPDKLDYEIRTGTSWAAGVFLTRIAATSYSVPPALVGVKTYWIAARDGFLNYSPIPTSVTATITAPTQPASSLSALNGTVTIVWTAVSSMFPVDHYEIRFGASWAAGTTVGTSAGLSFSFVAEFLGNRNYFVAAVDIAGNYGPADQTAINVLASPATTVTIQVIDNNVLLYWDAVSGTLPTDTYEIRRGATYATSTLIGTKSGLFTTIMETVAGTYAYWVTPVDTAGNYGASASIAGAVGPVPNYQLKVDYNSTFAGGAINSISPTDHNAYISVPTPYSVNAAGAPSYWNAGRCSLAHSTGKWYWEVQATSTSGIGVGVGVANASAPVAYPAYIGQDANGVTYFNWGDVYTSGTPVNTYVG